MPAELEALKKKVSENLSGKTNPRTDKPYTPDEIHAIAQAQFKKTQNKELSYNPTVIEFKEESDGEFYSYGFVATTHPDRASKGNYKGDILTKNAINLVVKQINERKNMMADLASAQHDWIKQGNANIPPVGRAITAEVREMPNGHFGAWIKTHHDKTYPEFDIVKYKVEKGYWPGYSIEYEPKEIKDAQLHDGTYRVIDNLNLCGFGFASGRLIANPQALIEGTEIKEMQEYVEVLNYKESHDEMEVMMKKMNAMPDGPEKEAMKKKIESMKNKKTENKEITIKEKNQSEERRMDAEIKENSKIEIDVKEFEKYKKFLDMEVKQKRDEEMKTLVKEALSGLVPEMKVRMNDGIDFKEVSASVEYKEWNEIKTGKVDIKEAFNRATALAVKTGALTAWANGVTGLKDTKMGFKCTGVDSSRIEMKALTTTVNKSSDTDYLQSAAELSDIYASAVVNMLNERTSYFGILPKEDFSGRECISWRAKNVANASSGAYAEGGAVIKGNTTRQKLREEFKYYSAGFQVTGQMIESAKSGVGDIFQQEVQDATETLLSTMNVALFAEKGAFSDLEFLGLEYIADSTGNTTLYGLTRSATNLLGASGSEYSAQSGAPISKPTLRTAIRTLEVNGADRNDLVILCHPLQRDLILSLLDDAQRLLTSPRAGFEGQLVFDGVPLVTDKDANNDDIFVVNLGKNGMRLGVQKPVSFEELAKTDDSRSGFLKFYGNQFAIAPKQAVYMIQGLATS